MQIKTVTTTAGVNAVHFDGYTPKYYWLKNLSDATLYVSANPNPVAGADDVSELSAKASTAIETDEGVIYILGAGKVEIHNTDSKLCPFETPGTGSGGGGGGSVTVDSYLSDTSTNPVQNKVITETLGTKANVADIPTSLPADGGNADTVNNHVVNSDVPANLDTILDSKVDNDNIPPAEVNKIGGVKPDNVTLSVGADGTLSAQKGIDNIEIGSTNLYKDTKDMSRTSIWHKGLLSLWPVDSEKYMGFTVRKRSGRFNGLYQNIILSPGKYILSLFMKSSAPDLRVQCAANAIDSGGSYIITTVTVTQDWNKFAIPIEIKKESDRLRVEAMQYTDDSTEPTLFICGMALKKNTKDTAWSPAIEDITNEQKSTTKFMTQIAYPNNYLIYDDLELPATMVAIPKFYLDEVIDGAEHIVHPAFLVNGVEQNAIYISKYQNVIENDRAYSLPMRDPAVNINFDRSWTCCKNKGAGWHLMTNAEWAAIAFWCKKNGTIPKGNNNYGKDVSEVNLPQKAVAASVDSDGRINRVLTGSGRETWYHDGTYAGIADLNGNVWEWIGDIRLVYGELQIIPNATSGDIDVSASSADWKAVNANATSYDDLFITPDGSGTTANSVKLDWILDHWQWQGTAIVTSSKERHGATFASTTYNDLSDFCRRYIQALALGPDDGATTDDYFYAINGEPERCTFRGGNWNIGTYGGVFILNINSPRSHSNGDLGGRAAYINTTAQPFMMTLESDSMESPEMMDTMEITETEVIQCK